MSEPVLLLNPRRRRRTRNKSGQFVRSKNARRRRRRNPIAALANPRRRRRRRNPIAALANPRRRRRRRNPIAAFAANPRRRRRRHFANARRRRYHRNPIGLSRRGIMSAILPAATGAGGAILLDLAMNYIPIPEQFNTPLYKGLARVAGAFGIGYAAGFVTSKRNAQMITLGALTVVAYGVLRDLVVQNFPQLGLSGITDYDMSNLSLGYVNPAPMVTGASGGVGAYMRSNGSAPMGAYMREGLDTVNSINGFNDGM